VKWLKRVGAEGAGDKWWFNISTGEAEFGLLAPAPNRIGPFESREEALKAPAIIAARSKAWAQEDREED